MSKYEEAVQSELARQQAEYEKAQNSGDYSAQAPDETAIRALYAFLREHGAPATPTASGPDFAAMISRIGDRYWSVPEAAFIDAPADSANVVDLNTPTPSYLRKTLEFYKLPVGDDLLSASELTTRKREAIDAETSATILAGFDYEINGETLHFSYDAFDQQNFADTANACLLYKSAAQGSTDVLPLPTTVTWNAYRHADGSLVRLTLTADEFLALYTAGALNHKAACMELGGAKKADLAAQAGEIA